MTNVVLDGGELLRSVHLSISIRWPRMLKLRFAAFSLLFKLATACLGVTATVDVAIAPTGGPTVR